MRDWDGKLRRLEASGPTRSAAKTGLKERISKRGDHRAGSGVLTGDTTFPELVEFWIDDMKTDTHLAPSTKDTYERNMRTLVLGAFEHFTLREISVSRVDQFLKRASTVSYSRAKHAKVVLGLVLGLAARYDAIPSNPVLSTRRLHKPKVRPLALTIEQVDAIRRAVANWRRGPKRMGPRPDGQLEVIIEAMLGTSARIGEVLAIRALDLDLDAETPSVEITGTIVHFKGQGPKRQEFPKTDSSRRRIPLPEFAVTCLRQHLTVKGNPEGETLIFRTRNNTPFSTNNVRTRLRKILEEAGITGVTPHAFRRTVATTIHREAGIQLASETLGHSSEEITRVHYVEPETMVDPRAAKILQEKLAPLTPAPETESKAGGEERSESEQQRRAA
ncbi:MAG: tyrosine-type recombinase/integrase [Brachybacterium sp.]